jgi:hypothetical protein
MDSSHHFTITPLSFYTKALPIFYISNYTPEPFQTPDFIPPNCFHPCIVSTVTPIQVILMPKFSGSHPLSLQAIPILMIAAFV